ncbi:MAG: hypothetical protein EBU90_21805 [Proteobacteria bacterium]|nr:hypothetical protein [Pseudomonadota bacterium]
MKKYFYGLLFLTALNSQLNGMNQNEGPRGQAIEVAKEISEFMNNQNWQRARAEIGGFLLRWPVNIITEIMSDNEVSPLINAVRANSRLILATIVADDKFNEIPEAQQTEIFRAALAEALKLNLREMGQELERLIDGDEEPEEDEA